MTVKTDLMKLVKKSVLAANAASTKPVVKAKKLSAKAKKVKELIDAKKFGCNTNQVRELMEIVLSEKLGDAKADSFKRGSLVIDEDGDAVYVTSSSNNEVYGFIVGHGESEDDHLLMEAKLATKAQIEAWVRSLENSKSYESDIGIVISSIK